MPIRGVVHDHLRLDLRCTLLHLKLFIKPAATTFLRTTTAAEVSIEETNKLRLSLGLKPLVDDAGSSNDLDKLAEDN